MEEKKSNPIKVFLYISVWVIIWGTLGSFIDYPLYKNKINLSINFEIAIFMDNNFCLNLFYNLESNLIIN